MNIEELFCLDGVIQATINLLESAYEKACEEPTTMSIPAFEHQNIGDQLLKMYADDIGYTVEEVKTAGQVSTPIFLYQCIQLMKTRLSAKATATVPE